MNAILIKDKEQSLLSFNVNNHRSNNLTSTLNRITCLPRTWTPLKLVFGFMLQTGILGDS